MQPVTIPLVQLPVAPNLTVEKQISEEEPPNLTVEMEVSEEKA